MTGYIVLHSALGLTEGVRMFAESIAEMDNEVETPDYYAGKVFDSYEPGLAYRDEVGYKELFERVTGLDVGDKVLVGFSLGASFAQRLTAKAKRPPRLVALVGSVDAWPMGKQWPGVPVQVHHLADDPWVEIDAMRSLEVAVTASEASFEDFSRPGRGHMYLEPGLTEYDPEFTAETIERITSAAAESSNR